MVMNDASLKQLAWTFKIFATLVWLAGSFLILSSRRGVSSFADVYIFLLALLSLLPNRWLVFSQARFGTFLILQLLPVRILFYGFRGVEPKETLGLILLFAFLFLPLPISVALSRIRFRRGQRFTYA